MQFSSSTCNNVAPFSLWNACNFVKFFTKVYIYNFSPRDKKICMVYIVVINQPTSIRHPVLKS